MKGTIMRLLVCGGREFTDVEYAIPRIHKLHQKTPVTTLICGMAKGGDSLALAWARELGIPVEEYPADWKKHGKAAGPIRNEEMLAKGKPDLVVGLPGGTGTSHMCKISQEIGVPVIRYRYNYFVKDDPVWGFLSNFYAREFYGPSPEEVKSYPETILYKTSEHYYQAEKTLDPSWKIKILEAETPGAAKKLGNSKTLPLRKDWNEYKLVAMMDALRLKFAGTPDDEITTRLLHTGEDYPVEVRATSDDGQFQDFDRGGTLTVVR